MPPFAKPHPRRGVRTPQHELADGRIGNQFEIVSSGQLSLQSGIRIGDEAPRDFHQDHLGPDRVASVDNLLQVRASRGSAVSFEEIVPANLHDHGLRIGFHECRQLLQRVSGGDSVLAQVDDRDGNQPIEILRIAPARRRAGGEAVAQTNHRPRGIHRDLPPRARRRMPLGRHQGPRDPQCEGRRPGEPLGPRGGLLPRTNHTRHSGSQHYHAKSDHSGRPGSSFDQQDQSTSQQRQPARPAPHDQPRVPRQPESNHPGDRAREGQERDDDGH